MLLLYIQIDPRRIFSYKLLMFYRTPLITVITLFTFSALQAAQPTKEQLEDWAKTKSQVILEFDEQDNLVRISGTEKRGKGEPLNLAHD